MAHRAMTWTCSEFDIHGRGRFTGGAQALERNRRPFNKCMVALIVYHGMEPNQQRVDRTHVNESQHNYIWRKKHTKKRVYWGVSFIKISGHVNQFKGTGNESVTGAGEG